MKNVVGCLIFLVVIGLVGVAPALGAELRMTGFFDTVFPIVDSNMSHTASDQDTTRASDQAFWARTRGRFFFNFIASDDLRGVYTIEWDNSWGAPRRNPVGSGCITEPGPFGAESCGFSFSIDNNSLENKYLYIDYRIPQIPIGNRWRLGGFPIRATSLTPSTLLHHDVGGGDLLLTLTDQVSVLLYYTQFQENVETFTGIPNRLGESYATGSTLRLRPLPNLDFHVLGAFNHNQAPIGPSLLSISGPFNGIVNDTLNMSTEDRYYVGFDARYRIGNTRIEPVFIYQFGDRKFMDGSDVNFDAFMGFLQLQHTTGPWLFAGRLAYISGNKANDDINNRGIGSRSDVKGYRFIGAKGGPVWNEWHEIMGKSDVNNTGLTTFRRMGETGHLDRFGWMQVGGKTEYRATDNLILEGTAGAFWTAEKTACPAVLRIGTIDGPCGGPMNSSGEPALNFTGNSRFVGWEVAAGLRYTIMPGLIYTPRLAYANYGDAVSANNRKSKDAWAFSNRMIYLF